MRGYPIAVIPGIICSLIAFILLLIVSHGHWAIAYVIYTAPIIGYDLYTYVELNLLLKNVDWSSRT
jgi:hypothetical protein